MEFTLPIPGSYTRTGPSSDDDGEPEQPGVDPFDVAWTLTFLIYLLTFAAHHSGHL